jgi:hypothetical protein
LSYYFYLMIEGSGSVPRTYRSGSGRPKNLWILRIRIWIRNNAAKEYGYMTRKAFLGWEAVQNESAGEERALHEVEQREGGPAREQDHGGAAQAGPHSLHQNRVLKGRVTR